MVYTCFVACLRWILSHNVAGVCFHCPSAIQSVGQAQLCTVDGFLDEANGTSSCWFLWICVVKNHELIGRAGYLWTLITVSSSSTSMINMHQYSSIFINIFSSDLKKGDLFRNPLSFVYAIPLVDGESLQKNLAPIITHWRHIYNSKAFLNTSTISANTAFVHFYLSVVSAFCDLMLYT